MQTIIHVNQLPVRRKGVLHVRFASRIITPMGTAWRRFLNSMTGEADATLKDFYSQICDSTHIVLHGGDTVHLLHYLRRKPDWWRFAQGKEIWCISAGISALAIASFNVDRKIIITGLGILPFASIVHYTHDKIKNAETLINAFPDTPLKLISDDVYFNVII